MDKGFQPLVSALTALGTSVMAFSPTHGHTMLATHGWNQPALTLTEIAAYTTDFAADIKEYGTDHLPPEYVVIVNNYAERCAAIQASTIPQLWGGNGPVAITAYLQAITYMREDLKEVIIKEKAINPLATVRLSKRLDRISKEVDEIVVDRDALASRMQQINDAHETAENLPEDLQSLKEARAAIEKISSESFGESITLKKTLEDALAKLAEIRRFSIEAEKLVEQCEEAYRVTTSKGLAGAFDQRATGLTKSMQLWVLALMASLCIAAVLGGQRVSLLSQNLAVIEPNWGVIALNFALSILSTGAPLWFAWVSTKQISQRFRLAEDYAYKASVAKAYEGYRREAAKLDPEFSARLFSSSLTRLEEAPLRLLEATSHGSPLHELMSSPKIQDALSTVPELRERFLSLLTDMQNAISKKPLKSNQTE
jgi:hypothetical protein